MNVTFHVISHTHWDREWYLPFETFRIELVKLIDDLLDILEQNKDFIFHLDGQSIILQDYLEIKPYKKDQIKKFVKSGNLLVGPWYVLSDQFLTSGESTIRNLIYGIKDASDLGNVMLVGYLPDQFGQVAQLPQILKGFNISSAIIGRGIQDSISEHNWHGLNEDNILAVSLTHWYNNAQRFPTEKEALHKYLDKIYEIQSSTSSSRHILLMNGCDHLFPQGNLMTILKNVSSNKKWNILQDSLPRALESISKNSKKENYPICVGELRDDNNKYILSGTLSSRVYLKLANYKCQTKLEKIIEPLSTLLAISKKSAYPYDEIKYAWRLLIQNHAHDSICGCSIDDVHKEMEVRFLKVNQVLDKLQDNRDIAMRCLYLQLFNLTNIQRNEIIETEIEFPLGPPSEHPSASPTVNKEKISNIVLKHKNKIIDCEILDSCETYKMVRSKDEVPLLQAVQKIKLLFKADLDPFSVCSYEIEERNDKSTRRQDGETRMDFENQSYKLNINQDGTISLLLKENNYKFDNMHFFEVEDDLGDEYNFIPGKSPKISSKNWKWIIRTIEENKFREKFVLKTEDVEIEITCYKDSNRIDFKTKINNQYKNKRIRLHFPTNLGTNYLDLDTAFAVIRRARPPVNWINYASSQPLHNWLDHSNEKSGLAFFGGGLADYELYEDGNGFTVTLIRAVGKLSSVKSHSLIETQDAQCNREIEFSYAIYTHTGNWQKAKIQNEQLIYQTPVVVNQSNLELQIQSLITMSDGLVLSSLKRQEEKENLYILRLFNPFNKTLNNCKINLNFLVKNLYLLSLSEEIEKAMRLTNEEINLEVKPYQILTFGMEV